MSYRVGLTGGIGSGKSTVAELFRQEGVAVLDADAISHQLTQPGGAAVALIAKAFGDDCIAPGGGMNRAKMRELIFSDTTARQRLEAILHPLIRAQLVAQAQAASSPYLVMVVPLLFEARDYLQLVQRVLVVDCAETTQVARAMQRSALTEQMVRSIMAQQTSRAERLRRADDVIDNDGTLEALRRQVERLHQDYLRRSSECT